MGKERRPVRTNLTDAPEVRNTPLSGWFLEQFERGKHALDQGTVLIACPQLKIIGNRKCGDQYIRIRHGDALGSKQKEMMANLKPKDFREIEVGKLGQRGLQTVVMDRVPR